jgi:hypothetical protein
MASPDKTKISAYLTDNEFKALKRVADNLGVSQSRAVIMAVNSLDEKISKGVKVSLPVSSQSNATDNDKIESLIKDAIAPLTSKIESLESEVEVVKKLSLAA